MKKSIFISHSSKDKRIANELCARLEERGVGCWVAPRDISPGKSYGEAIIAGLDECSVCLLLLTEDSNASDAVAKEIERAFSYQKLIVPLRLREVSPGKKIEFFVASTQWIDAFQSPIADRIEYLAAVVQAAESGRPTPQPPPQREGIAAKAELMLERAMRHKMLSATAAVLALGLLSGAGIVMQRQTQAAVQTAVVDIKKAASDTASASTAIEGSAKTVADAGQKIGAIGGKIDNVEISLQNVKKETSEDPRKEIANMGLAWKLNDFKQAIEDNNLEVIKLFARGGMQIPPSTLNYYVFNPYCRIPISTIEIVVEMAAVSDVEAVCDPSTIDTAQLAFIKREPRRINLARWICRKSKVAPKRLEDAMIAQRSQAAANATVEERRSQCVQMLRREFTPKSLASAALQMNVLSLGTISGAKQMAMARMSMELMVSSGDDIVSIYDKSIQTACVESNEVDYTAEKRTSELDTIKKLLF
jgi:hypothetical protein